MPLQWAYLRPIGSDAGGSNTPCPYQIPLDTTLKEVRYDVREWTRVSLQSVFSAGASSGVLTVYGSLDGATPGPATAANQLTTTSGFMESMDVSAIGYLIVRVTTAESGKAVNLFVMAANPNLP